MKIRNGFVSNSSSSSFLIIGTDNTNIIEELAHADKMDDNYAGYGIAGEGENLMFYGHRRDEGDWNGGSVAGVEAKELLEQMALPQARLFVQGIFRKIGIEVDVEDIDLLYGEMSSE